MRLRRRRRRLGNYLLILIVSSLLMSMLVTPVDAFNNMNNINTHTLQRNHLSTGNILSRSVVHRLQYNNVQPPSTRRQVVHLHLSMSSTEISDESNSNKSKSKRSTIFTAATLGLLALTSTSTIANAAKKVATTAAVSETTLILPTIPRLALVCILPTLLGYYKSEYGVSYGYGTAMAASSALILSSIANSVGLPLLPGIKEALMSLKSFQTAGVASSLATTLNNLQALLPTSLPAFHAFALFFYGTRLNLFLFYREVFLARFRAMRERIEERAKKQGGRLKRTPFLLSCAFLYFCMMTPLLITSKLCHGMSMSGPAVLSLSSGAVPILEHALRSTVVIALLGFLLGAFGDLNKTIGKAIQGEDALITGGIFRFFRHPNYTGEVIGWLSSMLSGFLAVILKTVKLSAEGGTTGGCLSLWKSMAPYLLLSVMGATGISFVLATATTGLEFRQKEKYGDTTEYQNWIKKSWVGFKMAPKQDSSSGGADNNNEEDEA